ncbi:Glucocorticoid Modulatory Element-Binding Protein 2 [Manis pentadactyla]|nr:Glucocorticoid Modulatory Element-Binding Protein 2 [Manis pentadactyla]
MSIKIFNCQCHRRLTASGSNHQSQHNNSYIFTLIMRSTPPAMLSFLSHGSSTAGIHSKKMSVESIHGRRLKPASCLSWDFCPAH